MTPREIIAAAWAITQKEKILKRWGFFSAFFETLLNVKLLSYQAYFGYAYFISGRSVGFFDDVIWLYGHVAGWIFFTIIFTFLMLIAIEWLVPHLALGAIIGLSAKSYRHEEAKGGLVLALYNFFPIFAIHEFLILSSWATAITLSSLVLRYVTGNVKFTIVGVIAFFWLLSNILKFFFSFAQPAVVIQRVGIFEAMGQSFKLIVSYLGQVMFLLLLLFVISLQIMINTAIVLVIPGIVVGLGFVLALVLSPLVSYIIASILGTALIVVAGYFFGILHVFREAVWTITYMELKKHKDLAVIER